MHISGTFCASQRPNSSRYERQRAIVLDRHGLGQRCSVGHLLPDGVDIRPVKVSSTVPSPAPDVFGTRLELKLLALFFDKQAVMRAEPRAVLRVGTWIIGETTHTRVAADGGEVAPSRMDDVEYTLQTRLVNDNAQDM